jgi:hypothetical protein
MADFTREDATRTRDELPSPYIPATHISSDSSKKAGKSSAAAEETEEDPLMAAMKKGMAEASLSKTSVSKTAKKETSGLRYSMLAAIAEDADLSRTYAKEGSELTAKVAVEVGKKLAKGLRSAVAAITRAQNISLVFLLDTTGSMAGHMLGVKDQIGTIVKEIQASGCNIAGIAFVGYKDWSDGIDHFEIFEFSRDVSRFSRFVSGIDPKGGGDYAEDVLGGLNKAINSLAWPEDGGTKIIFHIADAPPHGTTYHDRGKDGDDYPSGHPSDPNPRVLFGEMKQKDIMYYFGRINGGCDKMLKLFEKYYDAPIEVYNTSNPSAIADSVSSAVRSSVAATSARVGSSSAPIRSYVLNPAIPNWKRLPEQEGTLCTYDLPETIESIVKFDKLSSKITSCTFKVGPNPFSKGAIRLAYYAQTIFKSSAAASSETSVDDVIFKEMITLCPSPELDRMRYMVDMEVQTVAGKLAFEFNNRLKRTKSVPGVKLKYLMAKVLRIVSPSDGTVRFMMVEKKYRGGAIDSSMIKYTNNWNFVLADPVKQDATQLATAFSHFTFDHTKGYCMVCDIQGINTTDHEGRPVMLLTDPAIHCPSATRFGKTNLQGKGIEAFFEKHVCNKYCKALGLKSYKCDE